MKFRLRKILFVGYLLAWAVMSPAGVTARTIVLSDNESNKNLREYKIDHSDLSLGTDHRWSIRKTTLTGGRQEGVEVIEVNNGRLKFSVIPTRGMSIFEATAGDVTLGWESPVKEMVNPSFINLDRFGGLGWLDGFNEMMVRCGFEWAGHPGEDEGRMLTLHGLAGNIPASRVEVIIDDKPPHRIRIRGRVEEKTFKFSDFEMWTEISTTPGSLSFQLSDELTNLSDYEREYQIIYHSNFGPPLLEKGAEFVGPVKRATPFEELAARDIKSWTTYLEPTKNFGERVYNVVPYANEQGQTKVMLRNAKASRGVAVEFDVSQLPYIALWKNTDTLKEGYVTGLEPTTSFPYNRSIERERGRVPKLNPGESQAFDLEFKILLNSSEVQATTEEIESIQGSRRTQIDEQPEE